MKIRHDYYLRDNNRVCVSLRPREVIKCELCLAEADRVCMPTVMVKGGKKDSRVLFTVSEDVKHHERTRRTLTREPVWPSGKALGC